MTNEFVSPEDQIRLEGRRQTPVSSIVAEQGLEG